MEAAISLKSDMVRFQLRVFLNCLGIFLKNLQITHYYYFTFVTIRYNAFQRSILGVLQCVAAWQYVAVRHSGCVAVCCSVLHCFTMCASMFQRGISSVLQCAALCSSLELKEGLTNLKKNYAATDSLELKKGLTNLKKFYAMTHSRAGYATLRCLFYLKYRKTKETKRGLINLMANRNAPVHE